MSDRGPSSEKSPAQSRADALKAKNPQAYKYFARYTEAMLEADMDRPPAKKPKGWVSINSEEVRIKAILIRHSGMWPICMPYAVLTLGDLGLTFEKATKRGMRLGEDEGKYTFVLDKNGEPKPFTKAWIGRGLGMDKGNVQERVQIMDAKKILRIDGKRLSIDPAPAPLTQAERQKVVRSDYFLEELPQDLRDAVNGFKPSRADLELLAKLPEGVRSDYFQRLHDIHLNAKSQIDAIRLDQEKANKVVRSEMAILIEQVPQVLQDEASSSSSEVSGTSLQKAEEEEDVSSEPQAPEQPEPLVPEIVEESPYQVLKSLYPKDHFDEPKTKPAFERLSADVQKHCIERLLIYRECPRWKDKNGRWIPLSSNWIKEKQYDADTPPLIRKYSDTEAAAERISETARFVEELNQRYPRRGVAK